MWAHSTIQGNLYGLFRLCDVWEFQHRGENLDAVWCYNNSRPIYAQYISQIWRLAQLLTTKTVDRPSNFTKSYELYVELENYYDKYHHATIQWQKCVLYAKAFWAAWHGDDDALSFFYSQPSIIVWQTYLFFMRCALILFFLLTFLFIILACRWYIFRRAMVFRPA